MVKYGILILTVIIFFGCNDRKTDKETEDNFPELTGKYIGQNEPGLKP